MPEPDITNNDIISAWGNATQDAAVQHGDEGDFTRQHLLNPVLFSLLGDVQGKTILDAGCGQGYLCRMLAKRGAIVTGVEPAEVWYRHCIEREQFIVIHASVGAIIHYALRPRSATMQL